MSFGSLRYWPLQERKSLKVERLCQECGRVFVTYAYRKIARCENCRSQRREANDMPEMRFMENDNGEGRVVDITARHSSLVGVEVPKLRKGLDQFEQCIRCGAVVGARDLRCAGCGACVRCD